jgi:hypothetical protein
MSEAAIQFLKIHGDRSLVSLGCGKRLNRLDNHIKLMVKCRLDYYVAIDRVAEIEFNQASAFSDPDTIHSLLAAHYGGNPGELSDNIKMFPNTTVEELAGIQCQVVVCQRVPPFRHWEIIIKSMHPVLILQEDLNGCELQVMDKELYKKTNPGIMHYQLQSFRPSHLIPGERNIILWRRRDFYPCREDMKSWWWRILFLFYLRKRTTPPDCGSITQIS